MLIKPFSMFKLNCVAQANHSTFSMSLISESMHLWFFTSE